MNVNTRYILPCKQLSDNVFSHAVDYEFMEGLYKDFFRGHNVYPYICTRYYLDDKIYEISKQGKPSYHVVFPVSHTFHPLDGLEFRMENRFPISIHRFPMQKRYDHERQSVMIEIETDTYSLELEGLLEGIEGNRKDITNKHFLEALEQNAFSYSFKLNLKPGITKEEIEELMSRLRMEVGP